MRLELLLEPAPGVLAEGPREGDVLHHHDRALDALRGQRGGDLGADVAAADQDDVLGRLGVGADRVGVAEGAQVVDALVLGALDAEDVDHRPGAEQRLAEGDLLPALQLRRARRRVERHHVDAAQQLDVVLLVPGGRVDVGVLAGGLAAQVLLRERRPFVGRLGLAADQQDRARRRRACAAPRRSGRRPGRRRSGGSRPRDRPWRAYPLGLSHAAVCRCRRPGRRSSLSSSSLAGVEHGEHLVAGLEHGVGAGHEALAVAQDRDQQAAFRHRRGRRPGGR